MAATPAWPPQSTPRLFVDQRLGEDAVIPLDGSAAHYLISVLRIKAGDAVKLFDDQTGEWLATAHDVGKRRLSLSVKGQLRTREPVPDLWLLAAPIKKSRIDLVAEKACELGVARYRPVITRRTIVERLNADRLRAHMIEAAEQCGRTALPVLDEAIKLDALLHNWPSDRTLYFADEAGGSPFAPTPGAAAVLIGPEGGFDAEERAAIRTVAQAVPISLGPRILRAETAAIAAMSIWMSAAGDWATI